MFIAGNTHPLVLLIAYLVFAVLWIHRWRQARRDGRWLLI
jgi:hypothetical protein